jgi:hypothetical protein
MESLLYVELEAKPSADRRTRLVAPQPAGGRAKSLGEARKLEQQCEAKAQQGNGFDGGSDEGEENRL